MTLLKASSRSRMLLNFHIVRSMSSMMRWPREARIREPADESIFHIMKIFEKGSCQSSDLVSLLTKRMPFEERTKRPGETPQKALKERISSSCINWRPKSMLFSSLELDSDSSASTSDVSGLAFLVRRGEPLISSLSIRA